MLPSILQFAKPFLALSPIWVQQEADRRMAYDDSAVIRERIRHIQTRTLPDATIMGCTWTSVNQMKSPAVHFNVQIVRQAGQKLSIAFRRRASM